MKGRMNGFSLLELSVIVLVLGMLTVFLWPLAGAFLQQREKATTHTLLEQADWALTGFVMSKHRLPCPAPKQDGAEDCTNSAETGYLPYKTLGIADARAKRVRYGVLRRRDVTDVVSDPEAESSRDPTPGLPRTADLTSDADQFSPLLAMIGDADTVFASDSSAHLPELSTSNADQAPPVSSYQPVQSWNVSFGAKNGLDFCFRLRVAEDPLPDVTRHVRVVAPGGSATRQIAYALALPGAQEEGAPNVFDPVFQAGNARIRAVTPGALWKRLECGEAMASIGHAQANLATAAVMLYRGLFDFEQSLEQAKYLSQEQSKMADFSLTNATVKAGAGGTASLLKITGALIAGKAEQGVALAKAIYSISVSSTAALGADASKESSARSLEMASNRYDFARQLRGAMKTFSEQLLHQARVADSRGLVQGKP